MPPLRLRGAGRRAGMASGHGVWVEQANWAEEWEKVNGHDLRRLRATVRARLTPHGVLLLHPVRFPPAA